MQCLVNDSLLVIAIGVDNVCLKNGCTAPPSPAQDPNVKEFPELSC